jgi:hypothetical protein
LPTPGAPLRRIVRPPPIIACQPGILEVATTRLTLSVDQVAEAVLVLDLTLDKGEDQFLVPIREHQVVERLRVELDIMDAVDGEVFLKFRISNRASRRFRGCSDLPHERFFRLKPGRLQAHSCSCRSVNRSASSNVGSG